MYTQPDDEQQRKQQAIKDLLLKLNPPKDVATSTEAGSIPSVVPGPMPERMPIPEAMRSQAGSPTGLPSVGPAPTVPLTPSFNPLDGITAKVPGMPAAAPMNMDRRGVPVPYLEGEKHKPGVTAQPYTRERAERFDYYNSGVLPPDKMRAAELEYQASQPNNFDSDPDTPGVQPWTFGKRLKAGLKTGAMGALQGIAQAAANPRNNWKALVAGGLGGFGAGEVAGAVNPEAASSWMFNQTQRPALEAEEAKRKDEEERALKMQEMRVRMGSTEAQTRLHNAQIDNLGADNSRAERQLRATIENQIAERGIKEFAAQHPGRALQADAEGWARDPITHAKVLDPETRQPFKLPLPASTQARPLNVPSGGAVWNPETKQVEFSNPGNEKPDAHVAADRASALKGYRQLKGAYAAADSAYQVAQDAVNKAPKDKDGTTTDKDLWKSYQTALSRRNSKLQELNAHVTATKETHPDIKGGIGQGGVGYLEEGAKPAASSGRANPSLVRNVNDLPKF